MFGFVAKITKGKLITFATFLVVALLIFTAGMLKNSERDASIQLKAKTSAQRIEFLKQFGWEVDSKSETQKDTVIPSSFDNVYTSYNSIQIAQGFDLSDYSGQTVSLYSLKITNYPKNSDYVYATILVSDNIVIGGDIHSTELDGFMHGFNLP